MLAIYRGSSSDLRYPFKLVVDGAQVDGGIVPRNGDVGNLHQLVTGVACAGQFLQGVGVVRKGTQLILGIHHPVLGGQAKPGTVVVIP